MTSFYIFFNRIVDYQLAKGDELLAALMSDLTTNPDRHKQYWRKGHGGGLHAQGGAGGLAAGVRAPIVSPTYAQ
ncbi:MAG TPA: hypothetical protein VK604_08210 [Bryobacteraceae bacterium]|nr:hypothetical protein [Bryobacteraceae bacterium]